jgi:WD40 repeat protein
LATKDCGERDIRVVTINSEGNCVATASGTSVKVWFIHKDSILEKIASFTCPCAISALAFDTSTTELIMGDIQGHVRLFELASHKPILVCGPTESFEQSVFNEVLTVRICSDQKVLLSAGYTLRNQNMVPCIHVWDRALSGLIKKIVLPCSAILGSIKMVDDTRILASFTNGELYSVDRKGSTTTKVHIKGYSIESATLSADGRYLVTANGRKNTAIWACGEGQFEKIREFKGNGSKFHSCSFSADGSMFLVGGSFGDLSLWSVREAMKDVPLADAIAQMKKIKETIAGSAMLPNRQVSTVEKRTQMPFGAFLDLFSNSP